MKNRLLRYVLHSEGVVCLLLSIVCIAVYYPILGNKLLDYWDDQWMVMNHYTETGWTFSNLWNVLTQYYNRQYGPMDEYLYILLYTISGGYNAVIFHAASLLLHIGCTCMAYVMFKRILICSFLFTHIDICWVSLSTALFFAVHPLNVESVAWMSASKILVYAFFYLWATLAYLSYMQSRKWGLYVLTIVLFTFSFGGKEQAVTFPIWLLLLYWITGEKLSNKRVWFELLPFFLLAFVFGVVTIFSQSESGSGLLSNGQGYPLWQRFIFACYSFTEYIIKSFIPYKLLYIYPFPITEGEALPRWMLFYPVLLFISILFLSKYLKNHLILFSVLFFCIHIAITLHIIPLSRFVIIADRYVYISLLAIGFLFAYMIVGLSNRCKKYKCVIIGVWVLYLIYLGIYANMRSRVWYDVDTLKKELRELIIQRDNRNKIENEFKYTP